MLRLRIHFYTSLAGAIFCLIAAAANVWSYGPRNSFVGFPCVMLARQPDGMVKKTETLKFEDGWKIINRSIALFPNGMIVNFLVFACGLTLVIVVVEYRIRRRKGTMPAIVAKPTA